MARNVKEAARSAPPAVHIAAIGILDIVDESGPVSTAKAKSLLACFQEMRAIIRERPMI
jgi:hypothetical protein